MLVGKTDVARCDFCGKMIGVQPDLVKIGDKLRHFHPESDCMKEFFLDRLQDVVNERVERGRQEELIFLYKLSCPACRWRFITKANMLLSWLKEKI